MNTLFGGTATTQESLFFKTLKGHVLPDGVDTFSNLVRERFRERYVSLGELKISTTFISSRWMSRFHVPAPDDFINGANRVVHIVQEGDKKDGQQILASLCFEITKKTRYHVFMTEGINGSESEVWFPGMPILLHVVSFGDVGENEVL